MPRPQSPPADGSPPNIPLLAGRFSGPFSGSNSAAAQQTRPGAGWLQELPLQGVTILAVEDSRFACEALRLIARRAGARLRRAETMAAARDHLRVYRPDVVLIDLGLPDGRGDALIRDLDQGPRRPSVVMGTSGSVEGRALALAAGADGFLDKPLENMAQLCRVLRPLLPELDIHPPPMAPGEPVAPDLWRCATIWPLRKGRCKATRMPTGGAMSAPLSPGSPATAKTRPLPPWPYTRPMRPVLPRCAPPSTHGLPSGPIFPRKVSGQRRAP